MQFQLLLIYSDFFFFCKQQEYKIIRILYTMNDTRKHTTKIVRMTSKQKYWYHASFKTGDLFLYL